MLIILFVFFINVSKVFLIRKEVKELKLNSFIFSFKIVNCCLIDLYLLTNQLPLNYSLVFNSCSYSNLCLIKLVNFAHLTSSEAIITEIFLSNTFPDFLCFYNKENVFQ